MGLQNVEKIEAQQVHEKTWFQKYCPTFAAAGAATAALVASTSSNAFIKAADVTTATTAAGGEEVLSSTGIWVLTIVVGIVFKNIKNSSIFRRLHHNNIIIRFDNIIDNSILWITINDSSRRVYDFF